MNQDGQIVPAQNPAPGEYFATDIIRYTPKKVEIAPGQKQTIRIISMMNNKTPPGEYRSHMLFTPVINHDMSEETGPTVGIRIPVILRHKNLNAEAALSDFKLFSLNDEIYLEILLTRSGTKSIYGDMHVSLDNKTIGTLKNVAAYLSVPKRRVVVKLDNVGLDSLEGKTLKINYITSDRSYTRDYLVP